MPRVLNIFDFDGTLFRSPEANPKLWAPTLLGKIRSPPSQGGFGWYQDPLTLQFPYVPERPDESWFNPTVLKKCRESIADPNAITVLLTGRLVIYEERIRHIMKCMDLEFDHYGLKTAQYIFTMDYKIGFIHDLVEKYKGQLHKITLYDDRMEHASRFSGLLQGTNLEIEVINVEQDVSYIPREQEIEMVNKLITKYAPQTQLQETTAYIGVMLDDDSHKSLLAWVPLPEKWQAQAHHMTIAFGTQAIPEGSPLKIGDEVELEVTDIGFDTRAIAVKVKGAASINAIPHITIGHAPGCKPADSNFIHTWTPISDVQKKQGILVQEHAKGDGHGTKLSLTSHTSQVTATVEVDGATSSTTANVEEVVQTTSLITPPLTIQTNFPETPKLRGTVHVRTMYGIAPPPARQVERSNFPKGLNIGEVVNKFHPEAKGKQIGHIVKQTRVWTAGKEAVTVEEIEDFVKNLSLS